MPYIYAMKSNAIPRFALLAFVVFTSVMSYWYFYPIEHFGPISIHAWRQADAESMIMRYYHEGLPLLQPRTYNVMNADGQAISEFPLLYWLSAKLYHLFGIYPIIARLLHWALVLGGLYALFLIGFRQIKSPIWGFLPSVLVLISPLLAYYGFNVFPDSAALGTRVSPLGVPYAGINRGSCRLLILLYCCLHLPLGSN